MSRSHHCRLGFAVILIAFVAGAAERPAFAADKPVLLYSRYYNAQGESRYLPDGTYKQVLDLLRQEFDVRVNSDPLNSRTLRGVNVVLISNPSDKAVGDNPPPPHVTAKDAEVISSFVRGGGGLIVMGNQENHNLEITDMNKLLSRFGLQFTNAYTDAKQLVLPKDAPIVGGLRWAYYTGNLVLLDRKHSAKPFAVVTNDLHQKPLKGERDQAGVLLGAAEPGQGRVLVVTDSGWIIDDALSGKGVGEVAIKEHDNWEIFRRLTRWAAHARPDRK